MSEIIIYKSESKKIEITFFKGWQGEFFKYIKKRPNYPIAFSLIHLFPIPSYFTSIQGYEFKRALTIMWLTYRFTFHYNIYSFIEYNRSEAHEMNVIRFSPKTMKLRKKIIETKN